MQSVWGAFLRLFFRLLYNELAWSYDLVAWLVSLGHWKAWGRTTLRHAAGERVLELGHGPGHLLAALEEQGLHPVGLDLSPNMGHLARERLRRADIGAPLVRARAQALPFHDGCFDTVIATFPTEFIIDPTTLPEVARTARPEGRLVVAVGARFDGQGIVAAFLSWLYGITGQNEPSPDALRPWLEHTELSPRIVREQVGQTTILLLVAERL